MIIFLIVLNSRKVQFQPAETLEKGHKNEHKSRYFRGLNTKMFKNVVYGFSRYPGCRARFEHAIHMDFFVLLGSNGSPPPQSFTSSEKLQNKPSGQHLLARWLICLGCLRLARQNKFSVFCKMPNGKERLAETVVRLF